MKTFPTRSFVLILAAVTLRATAGAQGVTWFTLDGGGGSSTGGRYAIEGTLGQPDAGALAGGRHALEGGFWNNATPWGESTPRLNIVKLGGTMQVTWPLSATGYLLEWSPILGPSSVWTTAGFPYTTGATHIGRSEPWVPGQRYYRLKK